MNPVSSSISLLSVWMCWRVSCVGYWDLSCLHCWIFCLICLLKVGLKFLIVPVGMYVCWPPLRHLHLGQDLLAQIKVQGNDNVANAGLLVVILFLGQALRVLFKSFV